MSLQPISLDLVPEILNIIREKNWPGSVTSYNKLNGNWTIYKEFGKPTIDVLTPDGKVDAFATFVLIIPDHRYELHAHTLHPDLTKFATALVQTPYIDWKKSPTLSCLRDTHYPLLDALESMLPDHTRENCYSVSFHIEKEKALNLPVNVPDNLRLDSLTVEDAEKVNRVWPHGGTKDSLQEVSDYIKYRPSVGLFEKDGGELVAWSLYGEYGGPGLLQVAENHKRKGYGEVVLSAISRKTAELGLNPHCFILPNNVASMGLFRKIGYESKYCATWTTFQCNTK